MIDEKKPRVGVAGIIYRGDEVLFGRRKGSYGEGTWGFPGGELKYIESFEWCLRREIVEETGLEVGRVGPVMAVTNDFFVGEEEHFITLFMKVQYIRGEPEVLEPKKCTEWRWFSKNQLPEENYLFLPIRNLLKEGYKL